jgi:hypothetical protein
MATEQKLKEPSQAAMMAVEEALDFGPLQVLGQPAEKRNPEPRLPEIDAAPPLAPTPDEDIGQPAEPVSPSVLLPNRDAVANDDRRNARFVLRALEDRPSRAPYLLAFLASTLWLGGFAALLWSSAGGDWSGYTAGLTSIQIASAAGLGLAPVLLFFITAMLVMRSQEMKLVGRAVSEVAMRLAEPESFSTEAVLSVSQAVRREVAAVGDGVERALARAGELETLVRSEIGTLERSYSDNEIRIRSLLDELVSQREAIVTNAERVRTAILGSHQTLLTDLGSASQRVVDSVGVAGDRVTGSLERSGG